MRKKNDLKEAKMKYMEKDEQQITQDKDFKYILNDTSYIYIGARFNYKELLEEEMVAFKLKTVISQYILKDVAEETTLESHFYYLETDSFAFKTYQELKVKIKVSIPQEKKSLTGKTRYVYRDKVFGLKEFAELNLAKKKQMGLIIRELIIPKMGLMTFTV